MSPLLFSIYLGDLQLYLQDAHKGLAVVHKMTKDRLDESFLKYLKLYVLLYAIVAESAEDLQKSITLMKNYCDLWKLIINVAKSMITIFTRGKTRNIPKFQFGETQLEVTDQYKYVGLIFNFNSKFTKAPKLLYVKGARAMFALLRRSRQLQLPVDIMIPKKLHLRFCKYILLVNRTTCSNMVYGERGEYQLITSAQTRMIMFLANICQDSDKPKISNLMYLL